MKLLSASDIWSLYSMDRAIDDCAAAFAAVSEQRTLTPRRTAMQLGEDRTFLVMPSASDDVGAIAVKTIGIFPNNSAHGLPTSPATVQLYDTHTSQPRAFLDGASLTQIRTGAASGVAFRYLARPDSTIGTVIGTGGQAPAQVLAMIAACPKLQTIRIVNRSLDRAREFIASLQSWDVLTRMEFSGSFEPWSNATTATTDSDLITVVTTSATPVFTAENLAPGVTISGVGSFQPHMQECGEDVIAAADRIYCDDVEAAIEESGDLIVPLDSGALDRAQIDGSIGEVITGKLAGRTSPEEIVYYKTVGVGAQDLWAAHSITQLAEDNNVGTNWG